ncbi:hypothetical protein Cflav_PD2131 [Pedosphaera parvula Ellin514]|uniref:Uncharacterized protein n=1 Tax=Pedosphaera parvula (strain Ellin514) TaxID=320771 RepID=B9XLN2_PEDPL|nr:hypothetical protein Cflav_PD2131 [Pedosphaera parvula Ellin514]
MIGLRVERNCVAAKILRVERIYMRPPWLNALVPKELSVSYFIGSITRPMNRMLPVPLSRITNKKG